MEETATEEERAVKRIARLIMGKDLVRIKHAFGNKASLYFGSIVPIFGCN